MKNYIVFDVGTYNTKILYGGYSNGYVMVKKTAVLKTPEGMVDNGMLDIDIASDTLSEFLDNIQINPKLAMGAAVVVSSSIVSRSFSLPYSNQKELHNMVLMEVERLFSEVLQSYVMDYTCTNLNVLDDTKTADVMMFALPEKIHKAYEDVFINIGTKPAKLDVASNSSSKTFTQRLFINDIACPTDQTIALMDIGHTTLNMQIIEKGVLKFCRVLKIGGADITKAIMDDLDVPFEEAQHLKEHVVDLSELVKSKATESAMRVLDDIANEIQRVLRYFASISTQGEVSLVYMYGGTSRIKNLSKFMQNILGCEVIPINTMNVIHLENDLPLDCYPSDFLNSAGTLVKL
ncbi:MAG: pilus assembly protein PilM [Oscillospiraceae bacterium]|nr:pilus assembly protein PilM [Oscillospiraceae bacterium]